MNNTIQKITPLMIVSRVCYYYDVTIDEIYSDGSTKKITTARKITVYILNTILNLNYR